MKSVESFTGINHEGIVQKNFGKSVIVSIVAKSACSGCHSESVCMLSGKEEKIVEVRGNYAVNPGDPVTVLMKPSTGFNAVLFGYLLPLAVLLTSLIILLGSGYSELFSGTASILVLLPYYLTIYLFRKRINEKFTFTLKA